MLSDGNIKRKDYFDGEKKMDLKDKKVLVIGTGLSGIGSAELLVKKGAHVLLLEQNEKRTGKRSKRSFRKR